jgi:FAD/FMN-containing dehydrogenase
MPPTQTRTEPIEAWGRLQREPAKVTQWTWEDQGWPQTEKGETLLPWGLGRSYGDVCLNTGNTVCKMRGMRLIKNLNTAQGTITCSGGTSLEEILRATVPAGWFPPVVPGTKMVTAAGATANDIHGKNHHQQGTWGNHLTHLLLARSDTPTPIGCSPTQNKDLFEATIGGLGLTGIILETTIKLARIQNSQIDMESIPFGNLEEFMAVNQASSGWPYTVAWIDTMGGSNKTGSGIYLRGEHSKREGELKAHTEKPITVPLPEGWDPQWLNLLLNPWSLKTFNSLYKWKKRKQEKIHLPYNPFFFPLDSVTNWNRIYGPRGFHQYQCVLPAGKGEIHATAEILHEVAASNQGSFLAVMKSFGATQSPGWLSFPMEGITLALDFPNKGQQTQNLLKRLDAIVRFCGGRLYPAKDARMSAEDFRFQYPKWQKLEALRDPKISSSFWRRTTQTTT